MEYFLTARDLTFRYFEKGGHVILDHVDFDLPKGKTIVLLGKSGSGKKYAFFPSLEVSTRKTEGFFLAGKSKSAGNPLPSLGLGSVRPMYRRCFRIRICSSVWIRSGRR